jgi:hypothetical protein
MRPETPVTPDEHFSRLSRRTTWSEIETLVRELASA